MILFFMAIVLPDAPFLIITVVCIPFWMKYVFTEIFHIKLFHIDP